MSRTASGVPVASMDTALADFFDKASADFNRSFKSLLTAAG
jgi:hypothetical protein